MKLEGKRRRRRRRKPASNEADFIGLDNSGMADDKKSHKISRSLIYPESTTAFMMRDDYHRVNERAQVWTRSS